MSLDLQKKITRVYDFTCSILHEIQAVWRLLAGQAQLQFSEYWYTRTGGAVGTMATHGPTVTVVWDNESVSWICVVCEEIFYPMYYYNNMKVYRCHILYPHFGGYLNVMTHRTVWSIFPLPPPPQSATVRSITNKLTSEGSKFTAVKLGSWEAALRIFNYSWSLY